MIHIAEGERKESSAVDELSLIEGWSVWGRWDDCSKVEKGMLAGDHRFVHQANLSNSLLQAQMH